VWVAFFEGEGIANPTKQKAIIFLSHQIAAINQIHTSSPKSPDRRSFSSRLKEQTLICRKHLAIRTGTYSGCVCNDHADGS